MPEWSFANSIRSMIYHKSNYEISILRLSEIGNVRGVRYRFAIAHTLVSEVTERTRVVILPDKLHFYPQTQFIWHSELIKILFVSLLKSLVFCSVHSHQLWMCKWSFGSLWPWEWEMPQSLGH